MLLLILVVVLTDAAAASCSGGAREFVLTDPPAESAVTDGTSAEESALEGSGGAVPKESEGADSKETGEAHAESRQEPQETKIWVHVCGAVNREGVYELPEGSRVFEAVRMAGGCTAEADTSYCNQAAVLSDAQKVYIPTKEESAAMGSAMPGSGETFPQAADAPGGRININTADAALLTKIPGIGESKAKSIIAYRDEHGPFRSAEDLMKVSGIAAASFEKMKDYITAE